MPFQVAVVGGSLAGLAAANVLFRLGHTVHVFEKFATTLHDKGASLGFVDVGLWETIRGAPMMRLGRRSNRSQGAFYYGDLWKFLFDGLPEGTVRFGQTIDDLGTDAMHPTIQGHEYDAVIIADGGFSSLRRFVTGDDRQPEYAGHMIYRVKVPLADFPGFTQERESWQGRVFGIALNVQQDNGSRWIMGGIGIGAPESEVLRPLPGALRHDLTIMQPLPDWFMPYIKRTFTSKADSQLIKWLELAQSKGKITPQPLFEYKANKVRHLPPNIRYMAHM